jgi:hypothetical protein
VGVARIPQNFAGALNAIFGRSNLVPERVTNAVANRHAMDCGGQLHVYLLLDCRLKAGKKRPNLQLIYCLNLALGK